MSLSNQSVIDTLGTSFHEVKETVRRNCNMTDISYDTWIDPLTFLTYRDGMVYLLLPTDNGIQQTYLNTYYIDFFRVTISEMLGEKVDVSFLMPKESLTTTGIKVKDASADHVTPVPEEEPLSHSSSDTATLNNKYRFETFVVGNNNNFAHSAALAVAESPGQVYNPLFLYGGPGLGKTHLMHSIGHFIAEANPGKKIMYVTSENFTNEVINSIRSGKQDSQIMTKFREKYRTVDVLLLDDVQFVIGKESTQEEFFHTFNELHQAGKQIVLSSDKPPRQMETLDERFRSRFEMGLIADIQAPDYETKMAILKKLGDSYPFFIEDDAYAYVADNIKSNIRELEGAFNLIIAHYRLHNIEHMTEAEAKEALKDFLHPDLNRVITYKKVIDTVCEHYNVSTAELSSKKRSAEIVLPRQIAMFLCRKYVPNNSYKEIGRMLGGRDHTTVISGEERIVNLLKTDAELSRTVDILVKKLNPSL